MYSPWAFVASRVEPGICCSPRDATLHEASFLDWTGVMADPNLVQPDLANAAEQGLADISHTS
jgi:hypothetical protein